MTETSILASLTPRDLGMPRAFQVFRHEQTEALAWLRDCERPVSAACLPTGTGKTLLAVAFARLLGGKAVYLTATKALQEAVLDKFEPIGMVSVSGRANYNCHAYPNCEIGHDQNCSRKGTDECPSSKADHGAEASDLVVTNYACWLYRRSANSLAFEGRTPVELLICDEAHALEGQLGAFASMKIYASELKKRPAVADNSGVMDDAKAWTTWAKSTVELLKRTKERIANRQDQRYKDADNLEDRCRRILRMNGDGNWVWQFDDRAGYCEFLPIHLSYMAPTLFSGVPRVLMMSASLDRFALSLILPQDVERDYKSWNPVFNTANSPVYHIPTKKLSWKSTDEDYLAVIQALDNVIGPRHNRKGIIHTVSYARARRILAHSLHRARFVWHDGSSGVSDAIRRFRGMPPESGALLVTPSVEEGFDFPGTDAEHQHLIKFPFPNETQRVIKERCNRISGYRLHYAAQKVVQIKGRAVRSESDRAELFIYDNACRQLFGAEGRAYCPPGFRIFTVAKAPPPINEKMKERIYAESK